MISYNFRFCVRAIYLMYIIHDKDIYIGMYIYLYSVLIYRYVHIFIHLYCLVGEHILVLVWWWWFKSLSHIWLLYSCIRLFFSMLLGLLSRFSHVQLCATPQTAAHQAFPSLGFSRQDYWSGLPFPSPMHESKTWKWSRSVVSDSSRPHGLQPTRLLCPWDFPGKSARVGCHCLLPIITINGV